MKRSRVWTGSRYEEATVPNLRRMLIGDSREREKLVVKLIQLVRADEREKTLASLEKTRERAAER